MPNEVAQPAAKEVDRLRDYVALPPLVILCVGGGAWLKLHAEGILELGGTVIAALGAATFLWNLVPEDTRKRARLDFAQSFKSRTLARTAWALVVAAGIAAMFVSSVHVTAKDDRTPVTVFRMTGGTDAETVGGDRIDLTKAKPTGTFLVAITPFGRSQWLRTSTEDRSPPFRVFPFVPRKLTYPDDFNTVIVAAVLPAGSFIGDFGGPKPLRLLVRGDGGRGDTLATDSIVRIEALLLSVGATATPDTTAIRSRWEAETTERLGVEARDAHDQVSDWMHFRAVRTRRALRKDEKIGIVVLSPAGDTLAADVLILSTPMPDVILRRRSN